MNILSFIQTNRERIEARLSLLVPEKNVPYGSLFTATRYALLGGGKRLRPLLALAAAETLGAPSEQALTPACCLEMVHTYSLIHDDLPCMDDDDFRRGKPSLHKAFPEGHAVLTGDYLLTYPFELLAKDPFLSAQQKAQLIAILAEKAGAAGMIGGQVMDLEAEGKAIDAALLSEIHHHKTGAMIVAAVQIGAVIGNATPEQYESLTAFAQDVGLAFQIVDDVLDVTASAQKHGKSVSSDAVNHKTTYAALLGVEQSQKLADHLYETGVARLHDFGCDTGLLVSLADMLVHREI